MCDSNHIASRIWQPLRLFATHAQEPGADGNIFVDKSNVVLPSSIQVLYQGLRQHVQRPLRSQRIRRKREIKRERPGWDGTLKPITIDVQYLLSGLHIQLRGVLPYLHMPVRESHPGVSQRSGGGLSQHEPSANPGTKQWHPCLP